MPQTYNASDELVKYHNLLKISVNPTLGAPAPDPVGGLRRSTPAGPLVIMYSMI
jgi:hypothetical protein